MKILLANKFFYPKGGADVSFFETADLLMQDDHEILFFSMKHPENLRSKYEKYFVSNVNYDSDSLNGKIKAFCRLVYSFEAKNKIENLIKDQKPDIIHLNNIYHQISPSILHAIKKYKLPVVMSLHDLKMVCASYSMLCNGKVCEGCKDRRYYNCFLKRCVKDSRSKSLLNTVEMYLHHNILHIYDLVDIFISPSMFLKYKLEEMGFKGKIIHLPNFTRLEKNIPQYNWTERSVVYFGRLSREKGLFTLIEALKKVKGITLKIIGEGPLKREIKDKIVGEGIDNIVLMGYKDGEDLENEIKKSMFIVLPSILYENNPRSIIEGFALGKPVIGSRIGGIPELVKDNETGLCFEPGNTEDLRKKIENLISNPDEIVEMGKKARIFAEKKLNPSSHYEKLMAIYKQAMNGGFKKVKKS